MELYIIIIVYLKVIVLIISNIIITSYEVFSTSQAVLKMYLIFFNTFSSIINYVHDIHLPDSKAQNIKKLNQKLLSSGVKVMAIS